MKLVFVSSTFKDMQFERDALHNLTAPGIDERLSQYGETVYFGDLRWGVNTTALEGEDGSRRVLQVCLDEIDDCKPYMIVLIGERYGWIPDASLIRSAANERGIEVSDDISVTQLEIEYGALSREIDDGRVFFYFRELDKTGMTDAELADYSAESDLHREKVDLLKKRIKELYPDRVRTYTAKWDSEGHTVTALDGFLSQVEEDITTVLTNDINSDLSLPWQERAMLAAHRYYTENAKHYCPIERKTMDLFDGPFYKDNRHMLFIKGEVGTGKTAYLSHLYCETVKSEGEDSALPFVLGLDKYSSTMMDYFKILLYKIEQRAGFSHYETDYGTDEFDPKVIKEIFSIEGLAGSVIHSFVDNCSYELQNALSLHLLDSHVKHANFDYFIGDECAHPFLDYTLAYAAGEPDVMLPPWFDFSQTLSLSKIKREETEPFVRALLKSKHKELADEVITAITQKSDANLPTYLRLVVERLLMLDNRDFAEIRRMGDGMDNINRYQLALIDRLPETPRGMACELADSVAGRVDRDLVMRTLALLVYTGVTLSDEEIKGIFVNAGWEYNSLDFALATRSLTSVIKYNPREKTYAITNPEVKDALSELLSDEGYSYVATKLTELLREHGSIATRLGEARFNAASYAGKSELMLAIKESYDEWQVLSGKLYGLLDQHGVDYVADVLIELVDTDRERDYGFLLERIPTVCTTNQTYELYYDLVKQIVDRLAPTDDRDDVVKNSFFFVAFSRFIFFKMRVNASDAAPFFYSFLEDGLDSCPVNNRAKIIYEITRLRFTAKEAYQTMSPKDIEVDLAGIEGLIDEQSCPRADEEYLFSANLNSAFINYVERSFDIKYYNPDFIRDMRNSVITLYEHIIDNLKDGSSAITSDDVATMIDTVLLDKQEYSSISYKRLCTTLRFMCEGQTYVDSRLNKYLPHILEASRFSFDEEECGYDVPVNLYKRLVAYSRAVAGTSVTLDECLFAAINMGYAADVLLSTDKISGYEYYSVLWDLQKFIRICLQVSKGDPRVLYRLYMPMHYLLAGLSAYGIEEEIQSFAAYLSEVEVKDELAPAFPDLFIGSLIYAYAQNDNEALRVELSSMKERIDREDEYAAYRHAYTPELMYIGIDIRSEEEIARDNEKYDVTWGEDGSFNIHFNYPDDSDDDSGDGDFDDGDFDDSDFDDSDFGDGDVENPLASLANLPLDIIRMVLEQQGIDTSSLPDELLMSLLNDAMGESVDELSDSDELDGLSDDEDSFSLFADDEQGFFESEEMQEMQTEADEVDGDD